MNIVSHVLYPMAFARSADAYRLHNRKAAFFNWKYLLLIGLFGGLPDILTPHINLESRYDSFSHSIWFLLAALSVCLVLAGRFNKLRALIFFCFFAVSFHVFCDMFSGGINLFAPSGKMIVGRYYIRTRYWVPLDVTGIMFFPFSCLYIKYRAPARSLVIILGLIVGLCGAGLAFSRLDTETFFLKRIPTSKMNMMQSEEARQAANDLFEKWQAGTFESLSDEFTQGMRNTMTFQWQESRYTQIRSMFGDYRGISFAETVTARFNYPHFLLYRFRGSFSRMPQQPEIGIYFDESGKISGFRWSDKFTERIMDY